LLGDREPAEESHFHHLAFSPIERTEHRQGLIEVEQVQRPAGRPRHVVD
jgi:hypothetical protein